MSNLRTKHTATYLYPGSFLPEETAREIQAPTFDAAMSVAPDEEEGYFRKDGWYAVEITTVTEKRFVADDGEEAWVRQGHPEKVLKVIIGERIHFDDIEKTDRNQILISNIRCNSRDGGYGVLTRSGNWQIASDYDRVLSPASVTP